MYHSIIFTELVNGTPTGGKNTWADWYLIPSSRPVFNPPAPKTKYVEIPGADFHLDLSTSLTGEMTYEGRQGTLDFIVDNGQLSNYHANQWSVLYSDIMDYLHGKLMRATLEDDPYFCYEGRFSVNSWKSNEHNSEISINYIVSPYKYETNSSLEDWKWDTFNFEHGIIREYKDLRVDGSLDFVIIGRKMAVTPTFEIKLDNLFEKMEVVFNGNTYTLSEGTSRIVDIRTVSGNNYLTFKGNGTVSIDYRGGCL